MIKPSSPSFSYSLNRTTNRLKLSRSDHKVLKLSCLLRSCLVFMILRWFSRLAVLGHRKVTLCHVPQNNCHHQTFAKNSADILWETWCLSNTPLYLFLLSTKGKDSPDGWQHFLSHCSSLGIGRLFPRREWWHHLMRQGYNVAFQLDSFYFRPSIIFNVFERNTLCSPRLISILQWR